MKPLIVLAALLLAGCGDDGGSPCHWRDPKPTCTECDLARAKADSIVAVQSIPFILVEGFVAPTKDFPATWTNFSRVVRDGEEIKLSQLPKNVTSIRVSRLNPKNSGEIAWTQP